MGVNIPDAEYCPSMEMQVASNIAGLSCTDGQFVDELQGAHDDAAVAEVSREHPERVALLQHWKPKMYWLASRYGLDTTMLDRLTP